MTPRQSVAAAVGRTIFGAMLGSELLSASLDDGQDLGRHFVASWDVLLPAIVAPDSLAYYREFPARQATRLNGRA